MAVFAKQFIKAIELREFYSDFIEELLGPYPACSPIKGCRHHTQNYFNFHKTE